MSKKLCNGEHLDNAVDGVLEELEKELSAAKGMGTLTEDKFDAVMTHIEVMKESNNKLKCIVDSIPKSDVNPEEVIGELK